MSDNIAIRPFIKCWYYIIQTLKGYNLTLLNHLFVVKLIAMWSLKIICQQKILFEISLAYFSSHHLSNITKQRSPNYVLPISCTIEEISLCKMPLVLFSWYKTRNKVIMTIQITKDFGHVNLKFQFDQLCC